MNDYVIINGVNSNTISGLKISKLPPITKPQMRTLIEAIDGRDGDLITDLGYSAYDKQLEIGLWGTYDINTVISFFNQEGTITFSNEADKFYNFKIINQIDYQKLLKFKTAVVVMHCQPFKYPTNETPIEGTPTTITGEGESLTLNNTIEAPMKIDLKGNTYQNGTPTPDTPQDIQVVSGDNTINVCGKNLYSRDNGQYNVPVYAQDGTATAYQDVNVVWIKVKPNTDYTTTALKNNQSYYVRLIQCTSDKGYIYREQQLNSSSSDNVYKTITTRANCEWLQVAINQYQASQISQNNWEVMVEENSTATTYESYQSQTYPINLGDIKLCKIGDYQDKIFKNTPNSTYYDSNLEDNVWYLNKQIGKVVLNGSEIGWNLIDLTNANDYKEAYISIFDSLILWNTRYGCANNFTNINYVIVPSSPITSECFSLGSDNANASGRIRFAVLKSRANSANEWKTWLSTHNTIVYYPLATSTNTEITDSTLISQLNALEGANSYDNQTNINQTNNDYPFWLSASTTFNAPITINNIGNIYAKPILELEGSGNITINLNSQDILAISLGDTTKKIVLDIPNLEAYNPTDSTLMNRLVVGDYMKFLINSGNNTLKIDGNITSYRLTSYSRWI